MQLPKESHLLQGEVYILEPGVQAIFDLLERRSQGYCTWLHMELGQILLLSGSELLTLAVSLRLRWLPSSLPGQCSPFSSHGGTDSSSNEHDRSVTPDLKSNC